MLQNILEFVTLSVDTEASLSSRWDSLVKNSDAIRKYLAVFSQDLSQNEDDTLVLEKLPEAELLKHKPVVAIYLIAAYAIGGGLAPLFAAQHALDPTSMISPAAATDVALQARANDIIAITEGYLLPTCERFELHRQSLESTCMGLQLVKSICWAYTTSVLHVLRLRDGGRRCLGVLSRAIPTEDTVSSCRLTVIHPILLHVARVSRESVAGLRLLKTPILSVSAVHDGVVLADYISYYLEGTCLLLELKQYEAAAECLCSVLSLEERECFGVLRTSSHGSCNTNLDFKKLSVAQATTPTHFCPLLRLAIDLKKNPRDENFAPSPLEIAYAQLLYVTACKLGVLVCILAFDGSTVTNRASGAHFSSMPYCSSQSSRKSFVARIVDIWNLANKAGAVFSTQELAPYHKLLHIATTRNLVVWDIFVKQYAETFSNDGLAALVHLCRMRLREYIVLDIAAVYDTMYLSDLIASTANNSIESPVLSTENRNCSAAEEILHTLNSLQRAGYLRYRLSHAQQCLEKDCNEEDVLGKGIVEDEKTQMEVAAQTSCVVHLSLIRDAIPTRHYGWLYHIEELTEGVDRQENNTGPGELGFLKTEEGLPGSTHDVMMAQIRRFYQLQRSMDRAEVEITLWDSRSKHNLQKDSCLKQQCSS